MEFYSIPTVSFKNIVLLKKIVEGIHIIPKT